jgi:hypothetical protein
MKHQNNIFKVLGPQEDALIPSKFTNMLNLSRCVSFVFIMIYKQISA